MESTINLAFVTDRNFFDYTIVTIYSIMENTKNHLKIYVLFTNVDNTLQQKCLNIFKDKNIEIIFKEFNAERFSDYAIHNSKLSLTTYAKFLIPQLVPEDRVIYIDSDIIALSDLNNLWQEYDPNYSLMAVPNPAYPRWKDSDAIGLAKTQKSFNAGVLMLNLDKIRKENLEKSLFTFTDQNHNKVKMHDESAFNFVFKDDWKILPYYYNCTTLFFRRNYKIIGLSSDENNELKSKLTLIHFTGRDKPWSFISPHPMNHYWREYCRKSLGEFHYKDYSLKNIFVKIKRKAKFYLSYNNR